jgi:hypothetical protein
MRQAGAPTRYDYSDILRAVGHYLDTHRFRDVTVVELVDGFLLAGQKLSATERGTALETASYLFTREDLDALLNQAYARRGGATAAPQLDEPRYEDLLRAIGTEIDRRGWRHIVIMQTPARVHVKGQVERRVVDCSFSSDELRQLLATLPVQRATTRRWRFFG